MVAPQQQQQGAVGAQVSKPPLAPKPAVSQAAVVTKPEAVQQAVAQGSAPPDDVIEIPDTALKAGRLTPIVEEDASDARAANLSIGSVPPAPGTSSAVSHEKAALFAEILRDGGRCCVFTAACNESQSLHNLV